MPSRNEMLNRLEIKFSILADDDVHFGQMRRDMNLQTLEEGQIRDVWKIIDWTMRNVYEPDLNDILRTISDDIQKIRSDVDECINALSGQETTLERLMKLSGIKQEDD